MADQSPGQLKGLHTADGRQLSPRLEAEIVRELQRLELVLGMIETIEAERDAIASAKTSGSGQGQVHPARICYRTRQRSVLPIF
jgi:hypothetical protein